MEEYEEGRLVSGGALCEGCGKAMEEGKKVYVRSREVDPSGKYLYCLECKPAEEGLPGEVLCVESALAVEELGESGEDMVIEVKAGSSCIKCGRVFEPGEWLFVGVVETLLGGFILCEECYRKKTGKEGEPGKNG
jgi:hypothetical protein